MKIAPGMIIKTNYNREPYLVVGVRSGCTCPFYIDEISMDDPPPTAPHMHIDCTGVDGKGRYSLSHFDERTLRSLDKTYCGLKDKPDHDWIEIVGQAGPVQMRLF